MAKQKQCKLLKGILSAAAASGAVYFGFGAFLFNQTLSRKAADRGYIKEDILAGRPLPKEKSFLEKLFVKIAGEASGMDGFFETPYFPVYQEGVRWYLDKNPEKAVTDSPRGVRAHAEIIRSEKPSDLWLICLHGYSGRIWGGGPFVKRFHEWGFNALMPHACAHGESEDKYVSMGWFDRLDVLAWIDYLNREYDNPRIVLYGGSMGGATVMMTVGECLPENVVCAIADSGYTSAYDVFDMQARTTFHTGPLTKPGLHALNTVARLRAGFSLRDASSAAQLKKAKTPTLFIHGDADKAVPFHMLQEVYDAAACEKEMFAAPGAGHGEAMYYYPEQFDERVRGFIDKHCGNR